jgi:hypothetical protein
VASDQPKTASADGIFKLLAWKTRAITRLLGIAEIGEPLNQEFQFPTERRVDGLYRLKDGSILNLEHQSSLSGRDDLARRLVIYHIMIKQKFPKDRLLQVVIYTGKNSLDTPALGESIEYLSLDANGRHGVHFSAALVNFRSTPVDEFRNSGLIDDLILGLMARGGGDAAYIRDVIARIRTMEGDAKASAIDKFVAVCATMPDREVGRIDLGEKDMWIDDVKDSPFLKSLFKIAGKEQIEEAAAEGRAEGRRLGIAHSIVRHAVKHEIALPFPPEEAEAVLAARADEAKLDAMLDDVENMQDFKGFLKRHAVRFSKVAARRESK